MVLLYPVVLCSVDVPWRAGVFSGQEGREMAVDLGEKGSVLRNQEVWRKGKLQLSFILTIFSSW